MTSNLLAILRSERPRCPRRLLRSSEGQQRNGFPQIALRLTEPYFWSVKRIEFKGFTPLALLATRSTPQHIRGSVLLVSFP